MTSELTTASAATDVGRAPESESAQLMAALVRAAADPSVSPEKMSALFDLHSRMQDRAARLEFAAALARAQAKFPIVERKGKIVVYSKADRERVGGPPKGATPQQVTPYALYEDIVEAITPPLSAEGLSLSFETEQASDGRIIVKGSLTHRDGHVKTVQTPPMQYDSTGSKNSVQAAVSTISYGKRMCAGLLCNVVSRGEDNDGADGAPLDTETLISEEQYRELAAEITAQGGKTLEAVLSAFEIESLADLPAHRFREAKDRLAERRRTKRAG